VPTADGTVEKRVDWDRPRDARRPTCGQPRWPHRALRRPGGQRALCPAISNVARLAVVAADRGSASTVRHQDGHLVIRLGVRNCHLTLVDATACGAGGRFLTASHRGLVSSSATAPRHSQGRRAMSVGVARTVPPAMRATSVYNCHVNAPEVPAIQAGIGRALLALHASRGSGQPFGTRFVMHHGHARPSRTAPPATPSRLPHLPRNAAGVATAHTSGPDGTWTIAEAEAAVVPWNDFTDAHARLASRRRLQRLPCLGRVPPPDLASGPVPPGGILPASGIGPTRASCAELQQPVLLR
jgi:hypothetical protein